MNPWSHFEASNCIPNNCGCEFIRDEFIRQPINFWSSFVYLFFAWWLFREIKNRTFEFRLWIVVMTLLGVGSLLGHMTFTQAMMSMDFASIILVISFFGVFNVLKLLKRPDEQILPIMTVYYIIIVAMMYFMEKWAKVGMCLLIFAFSLGDLVREMGWSFLKARLIHYSLAVLAVSFFLFMLDELKIVCDPHGPWQLHTAWHIGTGFAIYLFGKWRFSETTDHQGLVA